MAAIPYDAPRPFSNTGEKTFPRSYAPIGAGQTFDSCNFVVISAGVLSICSNNAVSVSGLSDHPAQSVFVPLSSETTVRGLFGASQTNQKQPFSPVAVDHFTPAANGQLFEISLKETYLATMLGVQQVGITIDPTTNFWIASTALSACATIVKPLDGPGANTSATSGFGTVGDTGKRVIIQFLSAAVVGA